MASSRVPTSNDIYEHDPRKSTPPAADPYAGLINDSGGSPGAGAYSSLGAATNEALGTPSPEHTDSTPGNSFGASSAGGGVGFMAGDSGAFGGAAAQQATMHAVGQNGAGLQLGQRSPFKAPFNAGSNFGGLTGMGLSSGTTTDALGNKTYYNGQGGVGAQAGTTRDDSGSGGGSPDYESQSADMWANMLAGQDKQKQKDVGAAMDQSYGDEARAGRTADVQSAMLGQGVSGGGAQAGQAQVQLGGMAQRKDALNKIDSQYNQQGLHMKMAYLDTLIKRAEASKDRNLQQKLQAESDKTMLLIQGAGLDTTNYNKPTTQMNLQPG